MTIVQAETDEEPADDRLEIWAPNWPLIQLWLRLGTSWTVVGVGQTVLYVGLNYVAVDWIARHLGLEFDLDDLMTMEAAALPILNERS